MNPSPHDQDGRHATGGSDAAAVRIISGPAAEAVPLLTAVRSIARPEPASVRRRVLSLAWPAVIEQLLNMSVGLADTYIVGHLGAAQLAAVGLSMQTLAVFWAVFGAIGVGSTALVARHVGAGEIQEANRVAQQSVLLALLTGAVAAVFLWLGAPLFLTWLGAEPEVVTLGTQYLRAVAATIFMNSVLFVASAVLRGSGDTRTPMLVMLVVNGVNILVAYVLANGVSPFPALGVLGTGIGAASARGLGGLIMLAALVKGRGLIKVGLTLARPDSSVIGRILRIGLPTAGEQLLMRFGQVTVTTFITGLGTVAYAAHLVAMNSLSVAYMPGWGFALAATTLVGQELGAQRPDRASQSGYEAARMVAIIMTVMGFAVSLMSTQVMGIFTSDPAVIQAGAPALRIAGLAIPLVGLSFTFAGGLRGAGDTTSVLVILGASIWAVRVFNAWWLSGMFGLVGVWVAIGLDFAVRAMAMWVRFRSGRWKLIQV